jgi:methyl-accepting chemotaxis protein
MVDQSPHPTMWCDTSLTIRYMNRAGEALMNRLQAHLPVRANQIVGSSIDIFHKEPEHQRALLSSPEKLPSRARITLGSEVFDLLAYPIVASSGEYLGPALSWDIATDRSAAEERERETLRRAGQMRSIVEVSRMPTMTIGLDFVINYVNPRSVELMRGLEKYIPVRADELVGKSIDIFHRQPQRQRKILSDPSRLPFETRINLGPEFLDLRIDALYDSERHHVGAVLTWQLVTDRVNLEKQQKDLATHIASTAGLLLESSATLTEASSQVAAGSTQTAAQASRVSGAADQMKANVSSVASATEEMSATIREIAGNASESAKVARNAQELARAAREAVDALAESSVAIGQVTKVIGTVAQQTNLLALNATIEAARAGEAGKGFAVVANEVKALARETGQSADSIAQKIEGMAKSTERTVQAIAQITTVVSQIEAFTTSIAASVEEQAAAVRDIAKNSTEASASVGDVVSSISGVAEAASDGARNAELSQSAARKLDQLARDLQEALKKQGY